LGSTGERHVAFDGGVMIIENGDGAPPIPELFANRRWNEFDLSWAFRVNGIAELRL
jgi:hypothetical protein